MYFVQVLIHYIVDVHIKYYVFTCRYAIFSLPLSPIATYVTAPVALLILVHLLICKILPLFMSLECSACQHSYNSCNFTPSFFFPHFYYMYLSLIFPFPTSCKMCMNSVASDICSIAYMLCLYMFMLYNCTQGVSIRSIGLCWHCMCMYMYCACPQLNALYIA